MDAFAHTNLHKIRINDSNAKALRRSRELLKVTRNELASRLGVTPKTIEKYENGRAQVDEERILNVIAALKISMEDFHKIKRGKGFKRRRAGENKTVLSNADRRSYQKRITRECIILRSMRVLKKIPQQVGSSLCGYPRATIGHIENGRIELSKERIQHIVESYGYSYSDFEANLNKDELRDKIIEACIEKLEQLDETKLQVVRGLLNSL